LTVYLSNIDSLPSIAFFFFPKSFFLLLPLLSRTPSQNLGGEVGQEMVSFRSFSLPTVLLWEFPQLWFSNVFRSSVYLP
jgi:hypothetical protein